MANELLKAQIEAALFLTEKPIKAQAVARLVNAEVNLVRQMIIELIHDYESRNGGLEVADDDGYIIQVKDEYTSMVDEFVPIELPTALIRTLSAIAIKQPVLQSEIIKLRGAGAYDHIKDLITREFVNKREEGRSAILTTTKKFQEYFRLSKDGKSFRKQLSSDPSQSKGVDDNESVDILDMVSSETEITAVAETNVAPVALDTDSTETDFTPTDDFVFDATPGPDSRSIGNAAENDDEEVRTDDTTEVVQVVNVEQATTELESTS